MAKHLNIDLNDRVYDWGMKKIAKRECPGVFDFKPYEKAFNKYGLFKYT